MIETVVLLAVCTGYEDDHGRAVRTHGLRRSSPSMAGSGRLMCNGSSETSLAVTKLILCFAKFRRLLSLSQTNRMIVGTL
jgi:hypothetical protein